MQNINQLLLDQKIEEDNQQYFKNLPSYYQECIESNDKKIKQLGEQGLSLLEKYFSHLL
ncbi:hypothetical protein [Candidatus Lokiarchaeum ossiferum]|uniref:hypothetical protein n=1 Tax=Candidatus Lokiarchaeum ossiferum TaxID=2951803 RepID=UPI00352C3AC8